MTVHRISKPPIVAPERALRSEASRFHAQLQFANKTAPKQPRFAPVSTDGGGPGLPSLYPGGNSAMRQSWSFAPVHHDGERPAQVDQGPVVQDGWERAILDEQQRRAQRQDGWERAISDEQQRRAEAAAAEAAEELAALEAAADAAAAEYARAAAEAFALEAAAGVAALRAANAAPEEAAALEFAANMAALEAETAAAEASALEVAANVAAAEYTSAVVAASAK